MNGNIVKKIIIRVKRHQHGDRENPTIAFAEAVVVVADAIIEMVRRHLVGVVCKGSGSAVYEELIVFMC